MKMTLTALSLMLVLGSVSAVQAAPEAAIATQHRTTVSRDVATSRNVVSPASPMEGDFAATHTVNTHMGTFGVDANRVDHERPQGKAQFCSASAADKC